MTWYVMRRLGEGSRLAQARDEAAEGMTLTLFNLTEHSAYHNPPATPLAKASGRLRTMKHHQPISERTPKRVSPTIMAGPSPRSYPTVFQALKRCLNEMHSSIVRWSGNDGLAKWLKSHSHSFNLS